MFIIYDLIYLVLAIFYLPVFLWKRKSRGSFFSRLGFAAPRFAAERPIWIHAVSVGEVMAIRKFLEMLRREFPCRKLLITTVTPTGNKIARQMAKGDDMVAYFPLDFSFIVRHFIRRVNPGIFIAVETEIWPNLITALAGRNIPQAIINGRLSDKSYFGYRWLKGFFGPLLNKMDIFCLQTKQDEQRFLSLGVYKEKIQVSGNMKFDNTDYTDSKKDFTDYRLKLGLGPKDKLWVAGSTHPGEEKMILGVYKEVLADYAQLRLLLAPRHPERAKEVESIVVKYGFNPIRLSQLSQRANEPTVFILDTIGELLNYYAISDIVFIGGSLVKKGGQNILEPAALGKPVIFGPFMFNFRDIADMFLKNNAGLQAHNCHQLREKIKGLLQNPQEASELGAQAQRLIRQNQGASFKNMQLIKNLYAELSLPR